MSSESSAETITRLESIVNGAASAWCVPENYIKWEGDLADAARASVAENVTLRVALDDFLAHYSPKGGISAVPLGPFERARKALGIEEPTPE